MHYHKGWALGTLYLWRYIIALYFDNPRAFIFLPEAKVFTPDCSERWGGGNFAGPPTNQPATTSAPTSAPIRPNNPPQHQPTRITHLPMTPRHSHETTGFPRMVAAQTGGLGPYYR